MNLRLFKYLIKRLLLMVVTIFVIITITFFAMNIIPGGPFLAEKAKTPEVIAELEEKYGLDKPLVERYGTYLKGLVHLDFGPSIKNRGQTVIGIISTSFKTSAKIGGIAATISIFFGIVFGCMAALKKNKTIDKTIMIFTTASVAMPSFVIGTLLLIIFCVKLQVLPANGSVSGGLILPIFALALYPTAYITRLTRSSLLDVLGQDYIKVAIAKGLPMYKVIFKHALKNALIPAITYIGPMLAYIMTGSMVVENIFSVAGLGTKFVTSILNRDYPMIMGTTIFLAVLIVMMTFVCDILYKIVDPRIDYA